MCQSIVTYRSDSKYAIITNAHLPYLMHVIIQEFSNVVRSP